MFTILFLVPVSQSLQLVGSFSWQFFHQLDAGTPLSWVLKLCHPIAPTWNKFQASNTENIVFRALLCTFRHVSENLEVWLSTFFNPLWLMFVKILDFLFHLNLRQLRDFLFYFNFIFIVKILMDLFFSINVLFFTIWLRDFYFVFYLKASHL